MDENLLQDALKYIPSHCDDFDFFSLIQDKDVYHLLCNPPLESNNTTTVLDEQPEQQPQSSSPPPDSKSNSKKKQLIQPLKCKTEKSPETRPITFNSSNISNNKQIQQPIKRIIMQKPTSAILANTKAAPVEQLLQTASNKKPPRTPLPLDIQKKAVDNKSEKKKAPVVLNKSLSLEPISTEHGPQALLLIHQRQQQKRSMASPIIKNRVQSNDKTHPNNQQDPHPFNPQHLQQLQSNQYRSPQLRPVSSKDLTTIYGNEADFLLQEESKSQRKQQKGKSSAELQLPALPSPDNNLNKGQKKQKAFSMHERGSQSDSNLRRKWFPQPFDNNDDQQQPQQLPTITERLSSKPSIADIDDDNVHNFSYSDNSFQQASNVNNHINKENFNASRSKQKKKSFPDTYISSMKHLQEKIKQRQMLRQQLSVQQLSQHPDHNSSSLSRQITEDLTSCSGSNNNNNQSGLSQNFIYYKNPYDMKWPSHILKEHFRIKLLKHNEKSGMKRWIIKKLKQRQGHMGYGEFLFSPDDLLNQISFNKQQFWQGLPSSTSSPSMRMTSQISSVLEATQMAELDLQHQRNETQTCIIDLSNIIKSLKNLQIIIKLNQKCYELKQVLIKVKGESSQGVSTPNKDSANINSSGSITVNQQNCLPQNELVNNLVNKKQYIVLPFPLFSFHFKEAIEKIGFLNNLVK